MDHIDSMHCHFDMQGFSASLMMAGMFGGLGGGNKSSVNSKDCNVQLA